MSTKNKFSYFNAPIKNTKPYKDITLSDVAEGIKGDYFKNETEKLRTFEDVDKARQYKSNSFSYVTFSGTFSERKAKALIKYSGLIALDFDHVDVEDVKNKLINQKDIDTVLLFISPSGDGIKWIVPSTNADEHLQVFRMYQRYCKESFDLDVDESGKDIARACFIPHDENVVFNENFEFRKLEKYWNEPIVNPPTQKHPQRQTKKSDALSPFDDYNTRGDVISLLQSHGWTIEKDKNDETTLTRAGKKSGVSGGYRKSDKLFYVFTDATEFEASKAYNPAQVFAVLECGNDMKLARKKLLSNGYGEEKSHYYDRSFSLNEKDIEVENLIFEKGKFDAFKASELLKSMGYIRVSEIGRDEILIYRIVNGVMKSVNIKSDTVSIFMAMIKGHPKEAILANELHKARASVNNVWLMIEGKPYDLQMDTKDTVYIPFANGVAKITKGSLEIELIGYENLKLFMPTESMKHTLKPFDARNREIGNFEKFFRCASVGHDREELTEKEAKDVLAFYSGNGYLLSNFKDLALNKAIIFSDAGADDVNRNGRRGKTLIIQALRMFTPSIIKGGTEFDPNYRHVHAGTESIHKLYFIDDAPRNFNYHALYTNISGGISAERKGTKAVEIPYSHSPKFVITTNWVVPRNNDEASTIARFAEYQLSNFFNANHTPQQYFGEVFFQDWDEKEWQLFHEFMLTCIMVFLNDGLIEIEYSKEADNYFAYFSNSVVEEEMQRIMNEMRDKEEFTVTDFLREHTKEELYKYKPIFNSRNARDRINIWIEYHKLNWKYNTQWKKWEHDFNVKDAEILPF